VGGAKERGPEVDPTEIAREEKTSRGTVLRILKTTPFKLLEYGGIIEP
jgi:hypothetical protein